MPPTKPPIAAPAGPQKLPISAPAAATLPSQSPLVFAMTTLPDPSALSLTSYVPTADEASTRATGLALPPASKLLYVSRASKYAAFAPFLPAYPGATWGRLTRIKANCDPTNLFRLNQTMPPKASSAR